MLDDADRVRFYVFTQTCLFNLAKNTLVKRPISFGLPRQFLVADGGAIQCDRDALLILQGFTEIVLRSFALLDRVANANPLAEAAYAVFAPLARTSVNASAGC